MTDPTRLVDEGGTGLGTRLLRSAKDEAPPSASVDRAVSLVRALSTQPPTLTPARGVRSASKSTWTGLVGLGIVVSGIAVLALRASAPTATKLAPETRAPTSRVDDAPWVPVPSSLTEGASTGLGTPSELPEARRALSIPAPAPASAQALAPRASASVDTSQPSIAPPLGSSSPTEGPSSRPEGAEDDSFAAELRAIDGARRAIALGNYANGLTLLDAWAVSFPRRRFDEEASVLRMEALRGAGDREKSLALARDFLLAHPSSPLAQRVRSLVRADP